MIDSILLKNMGNLKFQGGEILSKPNFSNAQYLELHGGANEIPKKSIGYYGLKRGLDILGALFGFVILIPILLVISTAYLFEQKRGPIFFKQKRSGKNGEFFYIYKFRSMAVNAEELLKANDSLYSKYIKNNYKLEPHEDPRITKIGKFLRKTSLDELPQLINVLKGDMSLVGPRPVVIEELEEYGDLKADFTSVKPGLTGYWQAYGRSDIQYPERVNVELYYVYNQSTLFDLKIIIKTISSVIKKDGAY